MRTLWQPGLISRVPKSLLVTVAVIGALAMVYLASSRPWYFTSQTYLGGVILLELVIAAVCKFRQVFFTLLILAFLLAGTGLPGSSVGTSARWLFLAVGGAVGFLMLLKDRQLRFGMFHAIALFAVLAATVSALVSRYPGLALLKALSFFLLFLYAASGARLAVRGREARFLAGLLLGCELLVGSFAVCYLLLGADLMGNPNSLGAIMSVAAAPVLLWGTLVAQNVSARPRRLFLYALCMYLVYYSHSRASMVAAALSCGLLCIGLRRHRTLLAGVGIVLMLIATAMILQPERVFQTASTVTSEVVFKGSLESSLLASRQSPWQEAIDTINSHFWFGTGFGTTDKGRDASQHLGSFSSNSEATTEYGSSYLEIATWVGILGVLPFFLLLVLLIRRVFRIVLWMLSGAHPLHPAIPLAMVMVAGMLHAAFEDWMFAPGYYLCVFYWSMAFVLVDVTPSRVPVVDARGVPWLSRLRNVVSAPASAR